jgi:hypothetical protein
MKEIILDASLVVVERDFRIVNPQSAYGHGYQKFEPVTELDVNHRNYLDYLVLCWQRHYGVVISPTILWNMMLSNLAFEVNRVPEDYRKYFTDSDEKKEVIVDQGGYLIDPALLKDKLYNLIPDNNMDDFFPTFMTDTDMSRIANDIAFLDMVSPYYNYGMLLCGIPKIKVLGTVQDWLTFMHHLGKLTALLEEANDYLIGVAVRIAEIAEGTADFSNMFSLERCGSGSQVEVSGWIRDFFIEQPRVPYPENFVSCISKIDYKNYNEGGKEYRLYAGLFTSEVEDGYLVPAFANQYFEKL